MTNQTEYFLKDKISGRHVRLVHYSILSARNKQAIEEVSKSFTQEENAIKKEVFEYIDTLENKPSFCEIIDKYHKYFLVPETTVTPTKVKIPAVVAHQNLLDYIELSRQYKRLAKILTKYSSSPSPLMIWRKEYKERSNILSTLWNNPAASHAYHKELTKFIKTQPAENSIDIVRSCLGLYQIKSLTQKKAYTNLIKLSAWEEKLDTPVDKTYQNDAFVLARVTGDKINYLGPSGYFGFDLNSALLFATPVHAKRSAGSRGFKSYLLIKINMRAVEIIESKDQPNNNILQSIIDQKDIEKVFDDSAVNKVQSKKNKI